MGMKDRSLAVAQRMIAQAPDHRSKQGVLARDVASLLADMGEAVEGLGAGVSSDASMSSVADLAADVRGLAETVASLASRIAAIEAALGAPTAEPDPAAAKAKKGKSSK